MCFCGWEAASLWYGSSAGLADSDKGSTRARSVKDEESLGNKGSLSSCFGVSWDRTIPASLPALLDCVLLSWSLWVSVALHVSLAGDMWRRLPGCPVASWTTGMCALKWNVSGSDVCHFRSDAFCVALLIVSSLSQDWLPSFLLLKQIG